MNIANGAEVEIVINGETHKATYTVWNKVVTVNYKAETKSTQLGGLEAEVVAKMLLTELVNAQ